jgi:hypothetical protein
MDWGGPTCQPILENKIYQIKEDVLSYTLYPPLHAAALGRAPPFPSFSGEVGRAMPWPAPPKVACTHRSLPELACLVGACGRVLLELAAMAGGRRARTWWRSPAPPYRSSPPVRARQRCPFLVLTHVVPCQRSPAPPLLELARTGPWQSSSSRPLPELVRRRCLKRSLRAGATWSSPATGGGGDERGLFFSLFMCFCYVGIRGGPEGFLQNDAVLLGFHLPRRL